MNWQSVATKTVEVTRMEKTASDFVSLTSLSFSTCVMQLAKKWLTKLLHITCSAHVDNEPSTYFLPNNS